MLIRPATSADAAALAALVNRAYRPTNAPGWTHETDLVAGTRLTAAQALALLAAPGLQVLLAMAAEDAVQACVQVHCAGDTAEIGLLAVDPQVQQAGLGKAMLAAAEAHAVACGARRLRMHVLAPRSELIAFYQRRGYTTTDVQDDYPVSAGVGTPRQAGLKVLTLEKVIAI